MSQKLYKYAGADTLLKIFRSQGQCGLKCSYPKEFNDPYELFLTIDYCQESDLLASYSEIVGDISQRPTTCFSRSPAVNPMWAHYGHNHRGVVIEIDEENLLKQFPDITVSDVEYSDKPNETVLDLLRHASVTCKPRHVYFTQSQAMRTAYFTKSACWSYEQERRVVLNDELIQTLNGNMIFVFPVDCVTGIFIGSRSKEEDRSYFVNLAKSIACPYYDMRISRSTTTPFFIMNDNTICNFVEDAIVECKYTCSECREPVAENREKCPWCAISENEMLHAAERNPMRALAMAGLLEDYYSKAEQIGNKR